MHSPSDVDGGNVVLISPRERSTRTKNPDKEGMEDKDSKIKELKLKIKKLKEKNSDLETQYLEEKKELK